MTIQQQVSHRAALARPESAHVTPGDRPGAREIERLDTVKRLRDSQAGPDATRGLCCSRDSLCALLSVLQALLDLAAIPDSDSEPDA
jgi:hypothetical protein